MIVANICLGRLIVPGFLDSPPRKIKNLVDPDKSG
jgi:hypothetical protein